MSHCAIIYFKDGKPHSETDFNNSWGGAARIWNSLYNKYLRDPGNPYDSWINEDNSKRLWELARRKNLPLFERAVHVATFDYAIVNKEHFEQFVQHLQEFAEAYPVPDKVCHLLEWANVIKGADIFADAVGFHMTSVSENLWFTGYDEEKEEEIPYDLNEQDKHIEVYDYLKELDDG